MLACWCALSALALGCRGDPTTVLTRLEDARRGAAGLRAQFSDAAHASNRAVMADTDEASSAAAREAEQARKAVQSSARALAQLLEGLSFARETQTLREFDARFSEYEELDRRILALAVENTNLKARALAFGPASQAANGFRDSLERFGASASVKDRCRVDALIADAVRAVREIQVLHAPHIAERDDAAMTRMEKELADWDTKARAALSAIGALSRAGDSADPALAQGLAKLDELRAITGQIVALSRRNTNVLSLELSLGKKPALVAACDAQIRALEEGLTKEGPKVTR